MEVQYESRRPLISPAYVDFSNKERRVSVIQACFGTKAREWAYEEEVRYVVPLSLCEPIGGMYFQKFYPASLQHIIIGYRSPAKPTYFEHYLKSEAEWPSLPVDVATVDPSFFEMTIKKSQILNP